MNSTALSCLSFQNVQFDVVDRNGQPWLRSPQIGEALGYTKGSISIHKLYEANADEFTADMTALVKLHPRNGEAGQMREVRIFSLRGCHLLGMFARTAIAKEFRKWVLDVLEQHTGQPKAPPRKPIRSRADLSFTRWDERGAIGHWVVPSSHDPNGDWCEALAIGKAYFAEVIELAQHNINEARAAVRFALSGEWQPMPGGLSEWRGGGQGIEHGFATAIADALFPPLPATEGKRLPGRKARG